MDRGAWWATVHGVPRVGHGRVTKQQTHPLATATMVFDWRVGCILLIKSIISRNDDLFLRFSEDTCT